MEASHTKPSFSSCSLPGGGGNGSFPRGTPPHTVMQGVGCTLLHRAPGCQEGGRTPAAASAQGVEKRGSGSGSGGLCCRLHDKLSLQKSLLLLLLQGQEPLLLPASSVTGQLFCSASVLHQLTLVFLECLVLSTVGEDVGFCRQIWHLGTIHRQLERTAIAADQISDGWALEKHRKTLGLQDQVPPVQPLVFHKCQPRTSREPIIRTPSHCSSPAPVI